MARLHFFVFAACEELALTPRPIFFIFRRPTSTAPPRAYEYDQRVQYLLSRKCSLVPLDASGVPAGWRDRLHSRHLRMLEVFHAQVVISLLHTSGLKISLRSPLRVNSDLNLLVGVGIGVFDITPKTDGHQKATKRFPHRRTIFFEDLITDGRPSSTSKHKTVIPDTKFNQAYHHVPIRWTISRTA